VSFFFRSIQPAYPDRAASSILSSFNNYPVLCPTTGSPDPTGMSGTGMKDSTLQSQAAFAQLEYDAVDPLSF